MVTGVFMIELTRGMPLLDYLGLNPGTGLAAKTEIHISGEQTFISLLFSNEIFAGHMSMYGAVHSNLPLTYGSSFISLFSSLLPRFILPDRPPDIYQYYISIAENPGSQGFTINHATGWYLNFGTPGLIFGGILLGLSMAYCRNIFYTESKSKNRFYLCIRVLALAGMVAFIPMLIRTGPEGYKALAFEGILIPVLIIWVSQFNWASIFMLGSLTKEKTSG